MFRREILKNVRFQNLSLGEDVKFLRDCAKKGYSIYATTPYNYVYIRRKDKSTHTWRVSDQRFLTGSQPVAVTKDYLRFALRKHGKTVGYNHKKEPLRQKRNSPSSSQLAALIAAGDLG